MLVADDETDAQAVARHRKATGYLGPVLIAPALSARVQPADLPVFAHHPVLGDDVRQVRLLRWVLGAVFVAGLTACVVRGADGPAALA